MTTVDPATLPETLASLSLTVADVLRVRSVAADSRRILVTVDNHDGTATTLRVFNLDRP